VATASGHKANDSYDTQVCRYQVRTYLRVEVPVSQGGCHSAGGRARGDGCRTESEENAGNVGLRDSFVRNQSIINLNRWGRSSLRTVDGLKSDKRELGTTDESNE
jgi:hypothetical protein